MTRREVRFAGAAMLDCRIVRPVATASDMRLRLVTAGTAALLILRARVSSDAGRAAEAVTTSLVLRGVGNVVTAFVVVDVSSEAVDATALFVLVAAIHSAAARVGARIEVVRAGNCFASAGFCACQGSQWPGHGSEQNSAGDRTAASQHSAAAEGSLGQVAGSVVEPVAHDLLRCSLAALPETFLTHPTLGVVVNAPVDAAAAGAIVPMRTAPPDWAAGRRLHRPGAGSSSGQLMTWLSFRSTVRGHARPWARHC
jgi:hypothetical protein